MFHALRTKDIDDAKRKQNDLDLQYQKGTDENYKLPKPTYKFTTKSIVLIIAATILLTSAFIYSIMQFNQVKKSR